MFSNITKKDLADAIYIRLRLMDLDQLRTVADTLAALAVTLPDAKEEATKPTPTSAEIAIPLSEFAPARDDLRAYVERLDSQDLSSDSKWHRLLGYLDESTTEPHPNQTMLFVVAESEATK